MGNALASKAKYTHHCYPCKQSQQDAQKLHSVHQSRRQQTSYQKQVEKQQIVEDVGQSPIDQFLNSDKNGTIFTLLIINAGKT